MDPTCSTLRTWDCETCIQDILDMNNAEFVCQTMDPTCSTLRTWDCETCIQDILDMNNAMTSEAVATEFSNLLAGPSLCENPDYPFDEEGIQMCQATVAEFIPKALPVLFDP